MILNFCSTNVYLSAFRYSKLVGSISIFSEYAQNGGNVLACSFRTTCDKIGDLLRLLRAWSEQEGSAERASVHGLMIEVIPESPSTIFQPDVTISLLLHPQASQVLKLACFCHFGFQQETLLQERIHKPKQLMIKGAEKGNISSDEIEWSLELETDAGKENKAFIDVLQFRNHLTWLNIKKCSQLILRKKTNIKDVNRFNIKSSYGKMLLLLFDRTVPPLVNV